MPAAPALPSAWLGSELETGEWIFRDIGWMKTDFLKKTKWGEGKSTTTTTISNDHARVPRLLRCSECVTVALVPPSRPVGVLIVSY